MAERNALEPSITHNLGSFKSTPRSLKLLSRSLTIRAFSELPGASLDDFTPENFRRQVPLGRLGVPEDLREAVALFATSAGGWIMGQNLTIDGGWSAW